VEQRPDPGLARGDDLPAQRVKPPAEFPEHVLGQVSGMVADLPERLRAGQRARGGDGEDERERVAAAPGLPRSGTRASTASRPGIFPAPFLIMLVTAVIRACDTVPAAFRSGLIRRRHP
jgi:hypothetical protein